MWKSFPASIFPKSATRSCLKISWFRILPKTNIFCFRCSFDSKQRERGCVIRCSLQVRNNIMISHCRAFLMLYHWLRFSLIPTHKNPLKLKINVSHRNGKELVIFNRKDRFCSKTAKKKRKQGNPCNFDVVKKIKNIYFVRHTTTRYLRDDA